MNNIPDIKNDLKVIGPIKTDGHGSVYKGQRNGHLLSAIRLLPKPVFEQGNGVDQLTYIKLELLKLKRLGEYPHENVVTILDTGISKAGDSFYIEMEFISGPDLESILQIPDYSIFTIKDTLDIVEQLSSALDHCHRMNVIHGNIGTRNIKRDSNTGKYVVVNFGSAIMPEPQLRTTLPDSDILGTKPPEKQAGKLLYQTDIYGFGLTLYRLLAGSFPSLTQNNLPAKNGTRIAGNNLPELLSLRKNNIPSSWTNNEREQEVLVPEWLINLMDKCLETDPGKRFSDGMQIREYIDSKTKGGVGKLKVTEDKDNLQLVNQKLIREKEELQLALARQELYDKIMYSQWKELSEPVSSEEIISKEPTQKQNRPGISVPVISGLIIASMLVGAIATYVLLPGKTRNEIPDQPRTISTITDSGDHNNNKKINHRPPVTDITKEKDSMPFKPELPAEKKPSLQASQNHIPGLHTRASTANTVNFSENLPAENNETHGEYKVKSRAYFYNQPDTNTRRNAFIVHWNNAVLKPTDEQQDFIYVVFTNHLGQTSKGWLRKIDLVKLN